MASDVSSNLSPEHARDVLESLDRDRGRLADRITTPGWYHPTVAGLAAVASIAPALPDPWAPIVLIAFAILIGVLPRLARGGGIAMSVRPTGRATRILLGLQVGALLMFMVVSAAIRLLDLGLWWIGLIALIVFVLVLLLGKRFDRAQRTELSAQESAP